MFAQLSRLQTEFGAPDGPLKPIPWKVINVEVIEGKDLAKKDLFGKSDPYVVITCDAEKVKTKVQKKNLNPVWKETFVLKPFNCSDARLDIAVWDKDLLSDDFMGQCEIIVKSVLGTPGEEHWFELHPRPGKKDKVKGKIRIEITAVHGEPVPFPTLDISQKDLDKLPRFIDSSAVFRTVVVPRGMVKDARTLILDNTGCLYFVKPKGSTLESTHHIFDLTYIGMPGEGKLFMKFETSPGAPSNRASGTFQLVVKDAQPLLNSIIHMLATGGYINLNQLPNTTFKFPSARWPKLIRYDPSGFDEFPRKLVAWSKYFEESSVTSSSFGQMLDQMMQTNRFFEIVNPPMVNLRSLMKALHFNTFIQKFVMYSQSVPADHGLLMAEMFQYNNFIHTVTLQNLTLAQGFAVRLGESLLRNPRSSITFVDLSGNPITDAGLEFLVKGLNKLSPFQLASLSLINCGLSSDALVHLSKLSAHSLRVLRLSQNKLKDNNAFWSIARPKLQHLAISGCGLDLSIVAPGLKLSDRLSLLDAAGNRVSNVEAVADFLYKSPYLTHVILRECPGLNQSNLSTIIAAFSNNQLNSKKMSLTLDVSNNGKIEGNPLATLVSTIAHDKYIHNLFLENLGFGDGGVIHLLNSLVDHQFLTKLAIGGNLSGQYQQAPSRKDVAIALKGYLEKNNKLKWLSLRGSLGNHFGPLMGIAVSGLAANTSLTFLDISHNLTGDQTAQELGMALKKNRTLTSLYFDGNHFSLDGYKGFFTCLYGNKKLVDVPFPEHDVNAFKTHVQSKLTGFADAERKARMGIKEACRNRNYSRKQTALNQLREALRNQRVLKKDQQKFLDAVTKMNTQIQANQGLQFKRLQAKTESEKSKRRVKLMKLLHKQIEKFMKKAVKKAKLLKKEDPAMADAILGLDEYYHSLPPEKVTALILVDLLHIIDHSKVRGRFTGLRDQINKLCFATHAFETKKKKMDEFSKKGGQKKQKQKKDDKKKKKKKKDDDDDDDGGADDADDGYVPESDMGGVIIIIDADDWDDYDWQDDGNDEPEDNSNDNDEEEQQEEDTGKDTEFDEPSNENDDIVDAYRGAAGPKKDEPARDQEDHAVKRFEYQLAKFHKEKLLEARRKGIKLSDNWDHHIEQLEKDLKQIHVKVYAEVHNFEVIPCKVISNYKRSKLPRNPQDITIVTQCSVDRLDRLLRQCKNWNGVISVAVYMQSKEHFQSQKENIAKLHAQVEQFNACRLDIAVAIENQKKHKGKPFYPINILRNAALNQASTELVLLADIDCIPSIGMHKYLTSQPDSEGNVAFSYDAMKFYATDAKNPAAFVVPAFEHFVEDATDNIFTLSVPDLKSLYDNQKADGFHVQSFPAGHRQTCFSKWFQVSTTQDEVADNLKSYRVHYEEGFEPYVIAYRKFVPPYDERFRGYGMNKISHLYHMDKLGFQFKVLPKVFLMNAVHERSKDYHRTYSAEDGRRLFEVKALYMRFKQEITELAPQQAQQRIQQEDVVVPPYYATQQAPQDTQQTTPEATPYNQLAIPISTAILIH